MPANGTCAAGAPRDTIQTSTAEVNGLIGGDRPLERFARLDKRDHGAAAGR